MTDFWEDLLADSDEDAIEERDREQMKAQLMDALEGIKGKLEEVLEERGAGSLISQMEKIAKSTPQYKEAKKYLQDGLKYTIEQYGEEDDEEFLTERGTPICAIIDAVMIEEVDSEEIADLLKAINDGDDEIKIMEAIKAVCHTHMHLGMAVAFGMLIDEGLI